MSIISDIMRYWRFSIGLRGYLRNPFTLEQSQEIIKKRMGKRAETFLAILRKAVYGNKKSPYLKLLKLAGCEYGDIESSVRTHGIEATLKKLSDEGVWLSFEEFKGRKEVTRAGKVFKFKESDFDNPFFSHHFEDSRTGSRRAGARTMLDLDFWAQQAVGYPPILDANNVLEVPFAMWRPALAQGGELFLLIFAKAGNSPIKWSSQLDKKATKPSLKNRMLTDYLIYLGRVFGARWSKPEHMVLNDAAKIAQWIAETLKERQTCCIIATPSNASRICKAAKEKELHFRGAKFLVEGEPLTQRKLKEIESAGATALSLYWFTEGGLVGGSCPNTIAEGGVHVAKDCIAVVQHQRDVEHAGVPVNAFLFSSLLPAAPRILLNVESEDYGLIEQRHCGCKLAELGYTEHIYNIRSFGWFRAEGQRVFVTDLVKLMEEVLPTKFGGSPNDYQFLEEEDEHGFTRVSLAASPVVGSIDENALRATVLHELRKGLGYEKKETYREAAEVWSQANTLRLKQMIPGTTAEGKVLPLHIKKVAEG